MPKRPRVLHVYTQSGEASMEIPRLRSTRLLVFAVVAATALWAGPLILLLEPGSLTYKNQDSCPALAFGVRLARTRNKGTEGG